MPTSPALDALYAAWPIWPSNAATEAVKTITPRSPSAFAAFLLIDSTASRVRLNEPIRLIWMTRVKLASTCGPSLPSIFSPIATPAQLMTPWSAPNAASPAATAALELASSATSVLTNRADSPSSAASAVPPASPMSARTTLPPLATIMRADAAPRPDAAPVTKNMLPSICTLYFSWALNTVVAVATSPARSDRFDGTMSVLLVLARLANAATYCSATLRLTALTPPGDTIASAT